jgi:ferric-dicitrate binding protein FerR (iron transport regulator)
MTDDYLWDGSGTPDPDVRRLEAALGRLRSAPPPLRLPDAAPLRWGLRSVLPILATAAAIVLLVGLAWRTVATTRWDVERIAGVPRIGTSAVDATGRLTAGDTLTTDAAARARITISDIGGVVIDANSAVRLVETRGGHHRLALQRGTLHAAIYAKPGQFVVDTPSATATDLGCVYDLTVDDDGGGLLTVTFGWVAFDANGRESFVPAGASCRTAPDAGPGTPRYDDAPVALQEALQRFDFGPPDGRAAALREVLARARRRDAVTLWHLLSRVAPADRAIVFDAMAARVPPPAGVTRDKILALDKAALDTWWNALGLGDVSFWRHWKRPLPSSR